MEISTTLRLLVRQHKQVSPSALFSLSPRARCPEPLLNSATRTVLRCYASKAKAGGKVSKDQRQKDAQETSTKRSLDARGGSAKGKSTSTGSLVPGSQQRLDGDDLAELNAADEKMQAAVDWFRRECATMEGRGLGRVAPALLQSVRVDLPVEGGGKKTSGVPLADVAMVGVREGTTLIVTALQDLHLPAIEKAIYSAKIPHIVPQREDNRTIKIPVPRPTVEARMELIKAASRQAEEQRVLLRRTEQSSVKKNKYDRHSVEMEEFQGLLQKRIKEIDNILTSLKTRLAVK